MSISEQKGFVALTPVLITAVTLLSLATLVSEDAYALRIFVWRSEHEAEARAAAHSCASNAVLRLAQGSRDVREENVVWLEGGRFCQIEQVVSTAYGYRITTSALVSTSEVVLVTDVYSEGDTIVDIYSRKI